MGKKMGKILRECVSKPPNVELPAAALDFVKNTPITLQNKYFTNLIFSFGLCYSRIEPRARGKPQV